MGIEKTSQYLQSLKQKKRSFAECNLSHETEWRIAKNIFGLPGTVW